ncbi:hypothetical protein ACP4OV_014673 [Aristida adscensionis]
MACTAQETDAADAGAARRRQSPPGVMSTAARSIERYVLLGRVGGLHRGGVQAGGGGGGGVAEQCGGAMSPGAGVRRALPGGGDTPAVEGSGASGTRQPQPLGEAHIQALPSPF